MKGVKFRIRKKMLEKKSRIKEKVGSRSRVEKAGSNPSIRIAGIQSKATFEFSTFRLPLKLIFLHSNIKK